MTVADEGGRGLRRRLVISGRVQGVGYRWFAMKAARGLGLSGWVRNLPDGRVEVLACGSPKDLSRFEATLRVGPSGARVENVESVDSQHEAEPARTFEIR